VGLLTPPGPCHSILTMGKLVVSDWAAIAIVRAQRLYKRVARSADHPSPPSLLPPTTTFTAGCHPRSLSPRLLGRWEAARLQSLLRKRLLATCKGQRAQLCDYLATMPKPGPPSQSSQVESHSSPNHLGHAPSSASWCPWSRSPRQGGARLPKLGEPVAPIPASACVGLPTLPSETCCCKPTRPTVACRPARRPPPLNCTQPLRVSPGCFKTAAGGIGVGMVDSMATLHLASANTFFFTTVCPQPPCHGWPHTRGLSPTRAPAQDSVWQPACDAICQKASPQVAVCRSTLVHGEPQCDRALSSPDRSMHQAGRATTNGCKLSVTYADGNTRGCMWRRRAEVCTCKETGGPAHPPGRSRPAIGPRPCPHAPCKSSGKVDDKRCKSSRLRSGASLGVCLAIAGPGCYLGHRQPGRSARPTGEPHVARRKRVVSSNVAIG
jgi:hypothetical protein